MHGYSTDSGERRIVPLLLAAVAITLAWLSSKILAVMHLSLPWWLDAPSTLGYYGVLYALFDRKLWRNRLARKLGLVRVPNLAGRWRGYLLSSFDGHTKRHDLMINIFQSWTQIAVFLATETSISRSCAAVIQVDDPDGLSLTYQYQSQPVANAMRSMHMHFGTATLRVSDDDTLTGDYYAGRDRRTFGRICCWKEQCTGSQRRTYVVEIAGGEK
jgi:hypothetical protein